MSSTSSLVGDKEKKVQVQKVDKSLSIRGVNVNSNFTNTNVVVSMRCTGNNTIRTAWDPVTRLTWKTISAGRRGLKGARRGSPYAAELVGRELGRILVSRFPSTSLSVDILLAGKRAAIGSGIRGLRASSSSSSTSGVGSRLNISSRIDVTPKPHNGCRARKPRRV